MLSEDREIVITGNIGSVIKAFNFILVNSNLQVLLHKNQKTQLRSIGEPTCLVYRLIIPNSKTGGLIGRGGSYIKKLRQLSGARIDISNCNQINDALLDERIVTVSGDLNSCLAAYKNILTRVHEVEKSFSGRNTPQQNEIRECSRIRARSSTEIEPLSNERANTASNLSETAPGIVHFHKLEGFNNKESVKSQAVRRYSSPVIESNTQNLQKTPVTSESNSTSSGFPELSIELSPDEISILMGPSLSGLDEILQVSGAKIHAEKRMQATKLRLFGTPEEVQLAQYLIRLKLAKAFIESPLAQN